MGVYGVRIFRPIMKKSTYYQQVVRINKKDKIITVRIKRAKKEEPKKNDKDR